MAGLRAHLQLSRNNASLGKIVIELHSAVYPNTVRAFVGLMQMHLLPDAAKAMQEESIGFPLPPALRGSKINRINSGDSVEFGTSATDSFLGGQFPNEPVAEDCGSLADQCVHKMGSLSMSNIGADTNASNFFFCLVDDANPRNASALKSLNKNHVVFGTVTNPDSLALLKDMNTQVKVNKHNAPVDPIIISEVAVEQVAPSLGGDGRKLTKRERRIAELRERIQAKQDARMAGGLKRTNQGDPDGFGEGDFDEDDTMPGDRPDIDEEDARPTKRRRLEPNSGGDSTINEYSDQLNKGRYGASGPKPKRRTLAGSGAGVVGAKPFSFGAQDDAPAAKSNAPPQFSTFDLFAAQRENFATDLKDVATVQKDRKKKRMKKY